MNKKIVGILVCMLMIASVFGSASALFIESNKDVHRGFDTNKFDSTAIQSISGIPNTNPNTNVTDVAAIDIFLSSNNSDTKREYEIADPVDSETIYITSRWDVIPDTHLTRWEHENAELKFVFDGEISYLHGFSWDITRMVGIFVTIHDWVATAGPHEYLVIFDQNNTWNETDEGNNELYLQFTVLENPIEIRGGFRVSVVITNTGSETLTDVNWSIDLEGGLILAGEHTDGVISELAPGATKTIRQSTLYGIGRTTITVTAGDATKQATGFILGPLVLGVKEIS